MIHARKIILQEQWKLLYIQKVRDIFFVLVRGNPILSKVDFVESPLTQNARTLGRDCHRQCCFAFSFHLQTHQVLSEAKKSDAEKREKLLDLYARTEVFLDQLDTDFIETLQASLGDFKTHLKENIESFKPRDQYIVLVAGKFFILFFSKRETSNTFPLSFTNKNWLRISQLVLFDVLCCFDEDRWNPVRICRTQTNQFPARIPPESTLLYWRIKYLQVNFGC